MQVVAAMTLRLFVVKWSSFLASIGVLCVTGRSSMFDITAAIGRLAEATHVLRHQVLRLDPLERLLQQSEGLGHAFRRVV